MAIISVKYHPDDPEGSYEGIKFEDDLNRKHEVFNSGDPEQDFKEAFNVGVKQYKKGLIYTISLSSSCDHFVMDHPDLRWKQTEQGVDYIAWKDK